MSKHLAGHQLGSRLEHVGQLVTGTQSVQALEISLGAQRQAMQMLFEPQPDSYTHVALFCIHSLTVVVQMKLLTGQRVGQYLQYHHQPDHYVCSCQCSFYKQHI